MLDWLKKLITERLIGTAIGYLVSHAATSAAASSLAGYGVTVDAVKLQAALWSGWLAFAHWVEGKTLGTKWEWIGQVL